MKPFATLLVIISLLALAPLSAAETRQAPPEIRLYVVKIHADWCPRCRHMGDVLERVAREYGNDIRFVVLDVTDRKSTAQAQKTAEALGISDWFREYKTVTSMVALIVPPDNRKGPKVVTMLFNKADPADYTSAINKALGQ